MYEDMLAAGHVPNTTTYNALITAHSKAGSFNKVLEAFQQMVQQVGGSSGMLEVQGSLSLPGRGCTCSQGEGYHSEAQRCWRPSSRHCGCGGLAGVPEPRMALCGRKVLGPWGQRMDTSSSHVMAPVEAHIAEQTVL